MRFRRDFSPGSCPAATRSVGMVAASFHRSAPAVLKLTVSEPLSAGKATIAAVQAVLTTSSSSPIALSPDDRFAWMVDPENDRVTVVRVEGDVKQIAAQLPVGRQPACVAISPLNNR